MNLGLRRFEQSDISRLDSWSHAVGSYKYMQKVTPLNYSEPSDLSKWGEDYVWFVITMNNESIGGVWIDRRRPGETLGILGILIGKPDILGRGIGRSAISMALKEAVTILGITRVRLTVRQANERAIRAYSSVGFEVTGRGAVTLGNGSSVPFYRMESDLSEELVTAI